MKRKLASKEEAATRGTIRRSKREREGSRGKAWRQPTRITRDCHNKSRRWGASHRGRHCCLAWRGYSRAAHTIFKKPSIPASSVRLALYRGERSRLNKALHQAEDCGVLGSILEVRQQIYHYCLVKPEPIFLKRLESWFHPDKRVYVSEDGVPLIAEHTEHLDFNKYLTPPDLALKRKVHDRNKSLLLVNKQISEEALEILYGNNTFILSKF